MSITVFFVILLSSTVQALWNFGAKKTKVDKIALLTVGFFLNGLVLLPFCWYFNLFAQSQPGWMTYAVGSSVAHALYMILLGRAYAIGDISVVFPVSRGMGILGTAILSNIIGFDTTSTLGFVAIFIIISGIVALSSNEIKSGQTKGLAYGVQVGFAIIFYSIVDSMGSKSMHPLVFVTLLNMGAAIACSGYLVYARPGALSVTLKKHWWPSFYISSGGTVSYGLILWAFQNAPVSYVIAQREFSIVIAAFLGWKFLGEKFSRSKVMAVLLICLGVFALKLV